MVQSKVLPRYDITRHIPEGSKPTEMKYCEKFRHGTVNSEVRNCLHFYSFKKKLKTEKVWENCKEKC